MSGWAEAIGGGHEIVAIPRFLGSGLAFHEGLRVAASRGFEKVLFLDHDARMSKDAVEALLAAWGANGAALYSARQGAQYAGWRTIDGDSGRVHRVAHASERLVLLDLAPWSGLMVPADLCLTVRPDATYFFGADDFRFCLDARASGWRTFGVVTARMWNEASGPWPSWKAYYSARNSILFYQHLDPPKSILSWVVGPLVTQLARHVLIAKSPSRCVMWARGVLDACLGRKGFTVLPSSHAPPRNTASHA